MPSRLTDPAAFLAFAAASPEAGPFAARRLAWSGHGRFVPAAVLVGFVPGADGGGILLTLRSSSLRDHGNQISFPGGRLDADDAGPTAAALRETREELNIAPDIWQIHGTLPPSYLPSGYEVTPVLASARRPPVYTPSPEEVAEVFVLPQTLALDAAAYRLEPHHRHGLSIEMPVLQYGSRTIWGATAAILYRLAAAYSGYVAEAT